MLGLGLRRRFSSWIERAALLGGFFRLDDAEQWRRCKRIVFVCTGNICRSPYAEFVARQRGLQAISCGIDTDTGLPADDTAVREAGRRERDMMPHRTTRWEDVQLAEGDVVVALELRHALAVRSRCRMHNVPVVLMSSFLSDNFEVLRDPYGHHQSEYARVFDLIEKSVERMVEKVRGLTST